MESAVPPVGAPLECRDLHNYNLLGIPFPPGAGGQADMERNRKDHGIPSCHAVMHSFTMVLFDSITTLLALPRPAPGAYIIVLTVLPLRGR